MISHGGIAAIAICGGWVVLCILSWLWSKLTAPGFRVANKHVFITGGSSGLGLALAKQYARAGAKVSIIARDAAKLSAAKREIEGVASSEQPTHAVFAQSCDVTNFQAVQDAVHAANDFHKRITDHVVCNAGVSAPSLFLEQDVASFKDIMDINFHGAVHTVKAALPDMVENPLTGSDAAFRRRLVFVCSAAGLTAFAGYTHYSSSKYAMRGLAEALRNELKLYDIETSIYYPGNIDTPLFKAEELIKPEVSRIIDDSGGCATPEDAAKALVSGLSSGDFAITNEPILQVLRTLSNGVAPRVNTPLELVLLPIFVLIQTGYLYFMDSVVIKARKTQTPPPKKTN